MEKNIIKIIYLLLIVILILVLVSIIFYILLKMEKTMNISDGLMIFAVIAGPILAVQAQKWIERWKQTRERKMWVFKTLMQTRGTPLSALHVQALNMIDLEFSKEEKVVLEAWKTYLQHLNEAPQDFKAKDYLAKMTVWSDKTTDYLVELLYQMAKLLGYTFDKVQLKRGAYTPRGHKEFEQDQWLLRKGLLEVIYGSLTLNISSGDKDQGGPS